MTENPMNIEQKQAIIYYSGTSPFSSELMDELVRVLSPSLPVKPSPLSGGGATWLPPILELVIAFSSTTILTSILSKMGEDIYNFAKNKILKKDQKENTEITFRVKLLTEDIAISGQIQHLEDYTIFAEAINIIPQMINEAQNTRLSHIDTNNLIPLGNGNQFDSITKSGILFEYEYNKENKKWDLKNIGRIRRQGTHFSTRG